MDELRFIRQIWLDEKHEFDDSLPRIYEAYLGYREAEARIEEADRQLEEAARRNVVDCYTLLYREEEQCTSIVRGYFGED